jgi:polyphosphate kinase
MPRNFHRRVEVVFPVEDVHLKKRLIHEIIPTFLGDNVKARILQVDGKYARAKPGPDEKPFAAQLTFRELARKQMQQFTKASHNGPPSGHTARLTPIVGVLGHGK